MKHLMACMAILATLPAFAHAQVTMSTSVEYKIKNVNSGLILGISGASQTAGASVVQKATSTTTSDIDWHFIPMGNNEYNIENMLTHQLLGVSGASTSNGAQIVQYSDNATADHLWEVIQASDGNYMIKNINSGLYLEVANAGKTTSATIDQWSNTSNTCQEWTFTNTGTSPYVNPGSVSGTGKYVHDPMMLKTTAGVYWLYGTHNTRATSSDRAAFTSTGVALTPIPSWVTTYTSSSDLWAPNVIYYNSKYWQFYSASTSGSKLSAIGLATATTPNSTAWTDKGIVVSSTSSSSYNAIDPSPVEDQSGNWWLAFGSWSNGIYMVELNSSTMTKSTSNTTVYHLAKRSSGLEGASIYYYSGYYYLFASIDTCCDGSSSTYRTIVGRSSTINGTYYDRGGVSLLSGGGTILMSTHSNIIGPGGASVYADSDGAVIVYHYYDGNNSGTATLGINLLGWSSDGWPYIK